MNGIGFGSLAGVMLGCRRWAGRRPGLPDG